jgi:hypothetical protein
MKKFLILLLALALTACGAQATPQPAQVQPSPVVIVNTVVVTSVPAEALPTTIPSVTPLPPTAAPTLPPPTEAPTQAATQASAPIAPASTAATGPIQIDPKFNGPSFERITISTDKFSLNCQPKEISFDVYSTDVYIVRTELYFSIRDKHSTAAEPWNFAGKMETDGGNHFWMTFKGDQVKADLRKAQGWFDFQFVGSNRLGQTTDNWHSERITDIVSYMTNCP